MIMETVGEPGVWFTNSMWGSSNDSLLGGEDGGEGGQPGRHGDGRRASVRRGAPAICGLGLSLSLSLYLSLSLSLSLLYLINISEPTRLR